MIGEGAPGPVNCLIKYHDDGTIRCHTHGVDLKDSEEVQKHILEANVEWHQRQDALEAMKRVSVEVDWEKLAKDDPQKFMGTLVREMFKPPEDRPRLIGVKYEMQFAGGDFIELHDFSGFKSFEEVKDWILKAREVFRKGDL